MDRILITKVENILDFPNEILILLLEYLYPSDRRVLSETCKRFLELWLRDRFSGDRRLVFENCKIDSNIEPMETFMKTERKYDHLVFDNIVSFNYTSEWEKNFKETVTTIELRGWRNRAEKFPWKKFPKVETIYEDRFDQLILDIPGNIERLVIREHIDDEIGREILDKMMSDFFPFVSSSFRFELHNVWENCELFFKHPSFIEKLGVLIGYGSRMLTPHDFATIRLENLKHLALNFEEEMPSHEKEKILDGLKEQFPSLAYLDLTIYGGPPLKHWSFLKKLILTGVPLRKLPLPQAVFADTLEHLSITIDDYQYGQSECFFVHEQLPKKKLKKLRLYSKLNLKTCIDCFAAMTKAFPELESLKTNFILNEEHFKELATNTPKLKYLTIFQLEAIWSFETLPNLMKLKTTAYLRETFETWPIMPHLRKLKIRIKELNRSTVKFFEKIPAVEDLTLFIGEIEHPYKREWLEKLIKPLKRLKFFRMTSQALGYSVSDFVEVIASNCKYLREIWFHDPDDFLYDLERENTYHKLIKKHSALRKINGFTFTLFLK